MTSEITDAAYRGAWPELFRHLQSQPNLVNSSSLKGYTPLHQAAWHGAERRVIGQLLALGADPSARTQDRAQSAADIAVQRHPAREDLPFLLHDGGRTPAQLLRKLVADKPGFFESGGNQVLCQRVLACLCSGDAHWTQADLGQAIASALQAVAGPAFARTGRILIDGMEATSAPWREKIIPGVVQMSMTAHLIALERAYTVMSDLFHPPPCQWGLRGDPFLWTEMRQALCHVPIPEDDATVARIVLGCFSSLTGAELRRDKNLAIRRYAHGGMSSGMVCGEAWSDRLLPMLRHRAQWLRDAWQGND